MDKYSVSNPLILEESLEVAQAYLKNFVTKPDFLTEMKRAFGNNFDVELALSLVQSWSKSDSSNLPKIEIRSRDEINGANGAFASATNTVYLSREFLKASSAENIASVLLEEIGHAIDARLNQSDSPGDEGAIFSALVRQEVLSPKQLTALKTEDDTATITLDGQAVQIEQAKFDGTSGDDFIEGTDGADTIYLYVGNDKAYGDNPVFEDYPGYYGNDTLYGGDGNDLLYGEYPNARPKDYYPTPYPPYYDFKYRGSDDYLDGGNGDDHLQGDSGATDLLSTQGNDTLIGGNGNDVLLGYGLNDYLDGGEGNDSLEGGAERGVSDYSNTLLGGAGDDILRGGYEFDLINGGEGTDVLDYSSILNYGVNVDLDKGIASGACGIDSLAGIEVVWGSQVSDSLIGSSDDNILNGLNGYDFLEGGLGNDTLIGGLLDDTASYVNASSSVTVNLETGIATGGAGTDILNSIEGVIGSNFNDSLIGNTADNRLDGREGDDYLQSGSGNDSLVGNTGNDTLKGELGDDSLYGLAGNDYLDGGEGNDYLYGESDRDTNDSGNDTLQGGFGKDFLYGWGGDDLLDGGEGDDYLYGEPNSAAQVQSGNDTLLGGAGKDYLYGGDGNDILDGGEGDDQLYGYSFSPVDGSNDNDTLLGGSGNDFLYSDYPSSNPKYFGNDYLDGGDGDDYVEGGGGNDTLIGSNGADQLYGDNIGTGNDSLDGGEGDDRLYGMEGDDTLTGGSGNDQLDGDNYNNGTDWVSEAADTNFTLTNNQLTGLGIDTLRNIERANLRGGDSNNVLDASASTFGVVILSGEGGNDTLKGGSGNDTLIGVNSSSLNPGLGELDMLVGSSGADSFILGDSTWLAYDDRNTATNGSNDYAAIADFSPTEDVIQLQGSKSNYRLETSGSNTNLYIDKPESEPDELIAVIQSVTGLDLNSNAFVFKDVVVPGSLAFGAASYSVNEDGTTTTAVTVTRTGGSDGAVSVSVNPTDGTAKAPDDYDNTPILVSFANGVTSQTVNIPIVDDSFLEGNETVNLSLSNPTGGATLGNQNTATLTIVDNEVPLPGNLAFSAADYSVNEDGTTTAAVTVTRTGGSDGAVSVSVNPTDGTAKAPDDYNNAPILVSFANGVASQTVNIPIVDDSLLEGNETINLSLSNPTGGATLGSQNTATLTIVDNEVSIPGSLAFSAGDYSVNEDGTTTAAVTVTRTGGSDGAVSVSMTPADGTATAPEDYDNTPILVSFASGEANQTVNIPIVDDSLLEDNETINLSLSNPTGGATLGSQNTATLTIVDNDANHPPVAVDDTATTSQNTSLTIPVSTLLSNDTDEDGDTLTLSSVDNVMNGSVELDEEGNVVFTPATDFLGEASFDYTIADGNNNTDTAQVIVTVNPSQPTEGDDTLYGTPGNDTIDGLGGNDLIFGLAGNDSLYGGNDNDTLDGGEGDDYLNPGAGINAVIGGTGVDLLDLDYSDEINNLTINYTDPKNGTISDKSSFSEIEWVIFKSGTGNDTADLSAANYAEFRGNGGNDSFLGGAGNDYLEGGFGSDTLIGGEGNDVIEGWGGGDDLSDEGDYIDAGGGNDVVYGDAGNDSILGGAGNDHLDGVGGNDTLRGGDGDDRQIVNLGGLFGGEGDDLLYGDAGNDELWGQAGNDTVDGGEGDDVLNGNQGNDSISGGEGNDIARGGKDDDVVFGDAGNDRLFGDLGNDSLWGGEGRDEIIGGDGDDILIGGLGGDTLTGGDGNDQFVYLNFSDRTDQIIDFTPSKDLIVLTEVFSNLGYRGTNPINDGYMQLVQSGLNTLVQIDPDGAGFATFKTLVTLQNVLPNDLNDNSFQF